MMRLAEPAGRLLECTGNRASRWMTVHDRIRLTGQLPLRFAGLHTIGIIMLPAKTCELRQFAAFPSASILSIIGNPVSFLLFFNHTVLRWIPIIRATVNHVWWILFIAFRDLCMATTRHDNCVKILRKMLFTPRKRRFFANFCLILVPLMTPCKGLK